MQIRQPRRNRQQWHTLIDQFKQSGLTQHQFCESEHLSLATFRKWLYRDSAIKRGTQEAIPSNKRRKHQCASTGFNEVTISAAAQIPTGACLELPGNVRLHTSGIPPVEYLKTLVEALGHEH